MTHTNPRLQAREIKRTGFVRLLGSASRFAANDDTRDEVSREIALELDREARARSAPCPLCRGNGWNCPECVDDEDAQRALAVAKEREASAAKAADDAAEKSRMADADAKHAWDVARERRTA